MTMPLYATGACMSCRMHLGKSFARTLVSPSLSWGLLWTTNRSSSAWSATPPPKPKPLLRALPPNAPCTSYSFSNSSATIDRVPYSVPHRLLGRRGTRRHYPRNAAPPSALSTSSAGSITSVGSSFTATAWSTQSRTPRCLPTSSPSVSTRPSSSSAPRASAAPKPLVADHATYTLAFLFGESIFFSLKLCASFLTFCLKSLLLYITSTCSA